VPDLIAWLEEEDAQSPLDPIVRTFLALARAMGGQIEEGRAELAGAFETLAERGMTLYLAERQALGAVELELLAGNPAAAVELGTEGCRLLDELGERGWLSTAAAQLAQARASARSAAMSVPVLPGAVQGARTSSPAPAEW
jgi:hypothetical protein